MKWIALSAEMPGVIRDENGVPVEWTILKVGENPICQEGRDGSIRLSADGMQQIIAYHHKKGGKRSPSTASIISMNLPIRSALTKAKR